MQKMTHNYSEDLLRLAFEHHDNCVSCGYAFNEGDTSHLGYGPGKTPLYVCDACSDQLIETAVRYYFSPRPYEIPAEESRLWRYMDFSKFVSMLSTSSLYFSRADMFDDHFEGAKGLLKRKKRWDEHFLRFFERVIKSPPEGNECTLSEDEIIAEAKRLLSETDKIGKRQRRITFINCWHENDIESEAMWKLYSGFIDNAIAIRTTYSSLYESLGKNPSVNIGRVQYIDFTSQYAGIYDSFWRKRKSFNHENEVRAIIQDYKSKTKGKSVECNLSVLLEEIYISPSAPDWFSNIVNDVISKYGLNITVSPSSMNEQPFY